MKKSILIEGMSCGHCTAAVEKALRAVDGVLSATVDLASKKATIEAVDGLSDDTLKKAVSEAGYTVMGIN